MKRFAWVMVVLTVFAQQAWVLGAHSEHARGPKDKTESTKGPQDKTEKRRAKQFRSPSRQRSRFLARRLVWPSLASFGGTDNVSWSPQSS